MGCERERLLDGVRNVMNDLTDGLMSPPSRVRTVYVNTEEPFKRVFHDKPADVEEAVLSGPCCEIAKKTKAKGLLPDPRDHSNCIISCVARPVHLGEQ